MVERAPRGLARLLGGPREATDTSRIPTGEPIARRERFGELTTADISPETTRRPERGEGPRVEHVSERRNLSQGGLGENLPRFTLFNEEEGPFYGSRLTVATAAGVVAVIAGGYVGLELGGFLGSLIPIPVVGTYGGAVAGLFVGMGAGAVVGWVIRKLLGV